MSFALFVFYILCTYLRPFETLAPAVNEYRPMLVLLALALVTSTVRSVARREVAAQPVHFGLLALLVVSIGMSQVANQWASAALTSIGDFGASAMLMVLCFLNLTSVRRLQVTCVAIACSVVLLAALGTYSFHTGFMADELVLRQTPNDESLLEDAAPVPDGIPPAQEDSGRYFYRLRSLGFLNDPNDFAQVMVMVLPLLWWAYRPRQIFRNLLLVVAPAVLLGYAIYLTQSRGALLGVAALALLVLHRFIGTARTAIVIGLAGAALSIVSFGGREMSTDEASAAQRIDAWYAGWNMLKAKPIFGVGYGNFLDYHYLTAHNSFVLCFSEIGLVGYFAWLGLIVLTFGGLNRAVRDAPQASPERHLAVALRASLLGYMTCAWFLSRTYQPGLYIVLALGIAAWMCVRKLAGPSAPALPEPAIAWPRATVAAMTISIAAVYAFIAAQRVTG